MIVIEAKAGATRRKGPNGWSSASVVMSDDEGARRINVTKTAYRQARRSLNDEAYIEWGESGNEYRVRLSPDTTAEMVDGICNKCGDFVMGAQVITGFDPLPPSFALKLARALATQTARLILEIFARDSFALDPDDKRRVIVTRKLGGTYADWAARIGRSTSQTKEGFKDIAGTGILRSEPDPKHPGRLVYWLDLEALEKVKPRAPRRCDQPIRKKKTPSPEPDPVEVENEEEEIASGSASVVSVAPDRDYHRSGGEHSANKEPPQSGLSDETTESVRPLRFTGRRLPAICPKCAAVTIIAEIEKEVSPVKPQEAPPPEPERKARADPEPQRAPENNTPSGLTLSQSDQFKAWWEIFVRAGKALNFLDRKAATDEWLKLDDTERAQAFLWTVGQAQRVWRNEQFTPMPVSVLRGKQWTRVAQPRTIPDIDPGGKTEQMWDMYRALFAKDE